MEYNLRETILETINLVVNKGTETEHVKKMEIDAKKKNIGVNIHSYKLKHKDVNITDEDIESLKEGQNVTCGVIALFMALLEEAFETIVKGDKTSLMNPNVTLFLKLGEIASVIEEKI